MNKEKLWLEVKEIHQSLWIIEPTIFDLYEAFNLCAELTEEYDESHNLEHHVQVLKNAIKIYQNLGSAICPKEILPFIIYAAILHDTIDSKYPLGLQTKIEKVNNFLEMKLEKNAADVQWIINNMSYSKEAKYGYPLHDSWQIQLARDIVSDADKLEAIGDIGLLRCQQFSEAKNPLATKGEITNLIIQHCHDKLLKIKNYMRTFPGKQLAIIPHQIIVNYVNENKIYNPFKKVYGALLIGIMTMILAIYLYKWNVEFNIDK